MISSGLALLKSGGIDPAVAEILEQLADRIQAGETIDADQIARDYPEHAEQLLRLLPAVQALADLDQSKQTGTYPPQVGVLATGNLGEFRIIREVGRGGMGIVYEAEQISLGRSVALKVLPFASTMDERQLQRFKNEARAAASLHHEHIVPVHTVGCERGVHYYAMEFVDGQTLAQIIFDFRLPIDDCKAKTPSPDPGLSIENHQSKIENETVAAFSTKRDKNRYRAIAMLIADAADAMEYAHSLGIVHRDVKPGNLMLDNNGKLWVTDFGLARTASPGCEAGVLTMSGDLLGTLRYMAPEQAMARHGLADHRVDVYGLGCTLYELLTGKPAIRGEDKAEILHNIAFEEPVAPRKLDKHIPAELETITLKCLAKEPRERYASSGELAADLRRWLEDKAIKANPPGWREQTAKWARRHTYLLRFAAALLAFAAIAASIGAFRIRAERNIAQAERERANNNWLNALAVLDDLYLKVVEKELPGRPCIDPADRELLEKILHYYESFAQQNADEPAIRREAIRAFARVGSIRERFGEVELAEQAFRRALALGDQPLTTTQDATAFQTVLINTRLLLGHLLSESGRSSEV